MCFNLWIPKDPRGGFTLACPCLPVLEVVISTILQGRPFSMTKPFFLSAEHWMGYVWEAPELTLSNSAWRSAMLGYRLFYVTQMSKRRQEKKNQHQMWPIEVSYRGCVCYQNPLLHIWKGIILLITLCTSQPPRNTGFQKWSCDYNAGASSGFLNNCHMIETNQWLDWWVLSKKTLITWDQEGGGDNWKVLCCTPRTHSREKNTSHIWQPTFWLTFR